MKILLVDTLSEPGHLKFNQSIFNWLKDEEVSVYFSNSMAKSFDTVTQSFADKMLVKKSKLNYKINQIILIKNVVTIMNKGSYDKVLFLSYEPISMLLWSYFFKYFSTADIFVIEHNTVPSVGFLKKNIYKLMSKSLTHITLMTYISNYINEKFNKKTATIRHPMNSIFSPASSESPVSGAKNKKIIFMPSATIDADTTKKIFRIVGQTNGYTLYAKPNSDVKFQSENVILFSSFENYNEMIITSDVVVIPQKFDYRVSGVLYEALQSNSLIIVSDCIFGRFASECFPDRVFVVSDWDNMLSIIERYLPLKMNNVSYYSDWNKQGRDELYEALNANG